MSNAPAISESALKELVHRFYAKARRDPEIGPIFNHAVGDWDAHLEKLTDFWSSVMLTTGRYKGNPTVAHLRQKTLTPAHFERWLALFRETAAEVFAPDVAAAIIARAENIGRSLQLALFYRPKRPTALDSESHTQNRSNDYANHAIET
ncbi:MAG TPA: group III truncated hemoglobin [Micropepsaceae bacterium]|nr:group III truncated hemoglobin [Micropepsaceae bacterium]